MRSVSVWTRSPAGPVIAEDHPRISAASADLVLRYLTSATVVVATRGLPAVDWFDPGAGPQVGVSTYTGGQWFWNAELIYYVRKYHLSPGQEFLDHAASCRYVPAVPTGDQTAQVLALRGL